MRSSLTSAKRSPRGRSGILRALAWTALCVLVTTLPAAATTIQNSGTGSTNGSTLDLTNATVTLNRDVADLAVAKIVDDATPDEGQTIQYTVTVTNNGPEEASSVVLTDLLPAGVTLIDDGGLTSPIPSQGTYNTGTGLWTVGTIANSANATLVLRATVDAGTSGDTITNTTSGLASDQFDTATGNDVGSVDITVNNDADLAVAKIVDDGTPDEGQTIQYTVTVTNNGPAQATTVALTDLLPAGVTLIDDG
ncbi:MAG: DUF11 domain-containing protein, partial [bacterium]|nr:DUF11 domain-containing protein [bacterium]